MKHRVTKNKNIKMTKDYLYKILTNATDLTITDVSGKVALENTITLINGQTKVDIASLEVGIYTFNITLKDGQTSQFNVIKK